jgi:hypothetical protein
LLGLSGHFSRRAAKLRVFLNGLNPRKLLGFETITDRFERAHMSFLALGQQGVSLGLIEAQSFGLGGDSIHVRLLKRGILRER